MEIGTDAQSFAGALALERYEHWRCVSREKGEPIKHRWRNLLVILACVLIPIVEAHGQAAPPKGNGAANPAPVPGEANSPTLGFSIETEMLTYGALQSNSEAVGCDVARYLTDASPASASTASASICTSPLGNKPASGVIVVSSNTNVMKDLEVWRAEMAIMISLEARALPYCVSNLTQGAAAPAISLPGLGLTPAGQALGLAQNVIQMFATDESTSGVTGTIADQAFVNGVARELRTLQVPVMTPDTFRPFPLTGDSAKSPLLANLAAVFQDRACLMAQISEKPVKEQNGQDPTSAAGRTAALEDIEAFLSNLFGGGPVSAPAGTADSGTDDKSGQPKLLVPPFSPAQLAVLLAADDLERAFGASTRTAELPPDEKWQHILWIKALESGGTVTKSTSILGTKTRYSGGAVGTYALFALDGNVECSGNVYDYFGPLPAKDFEGQVHPPKNFDPTHQMVFLRGGCGPLQEQGAH